MSRTHVRRRLLAQSGSMICSCVMKSRSAQIVPQAAKAIHRAASLVILSLALCGGQTPPGVEEPETLGRLFFLDSAKHTLKQLPGEPWKREIKHAGRAGVKALNVVSGTRSSLRISSDAKIVFVYRPFTGKAETYDPVQAIQLFAFDGEDKNNRTCVVSTVKGRSTEANHGITLDVTKFGTSSYAVTPSSHLGPGEYWFDAPGTASRPIFTFGVD
jgi:hypothetical protein